MNAIRKIDFYKKHVSKRRAKNLQRRREILLRCAKDSRYRAAIQKACQHDILFWLNIFCWVYEPRDMFDGKGKLLPKKLPFITWSHQDKAILEIYEFLGVKDVGVEKSRGEGMSWIGVLMALHSWLYKKGSKIGLVSRDEDTASDSDNPDSLIWKIIWQMKQLPTWMIGKEKKDWKFLKSDCNLINYKNDSTIGASSATGNVFRGGRLTWALMDEFAFFKANESAAALNASHGATNSRLFVSTVNGPNTEFQKLFNTKTSMKVVIIDWKENPVRNRGLYKMVKGVPKAVDPENNPLPKHYDPPTSEVCEMFQNLRERGYDLEKSERSPWYDEQCWRGGASPQRIAQELDRDASGTEHVFFQPYFYKKAQIHIAPPLKQGIIRYDTESYSADFVEGRQGPHKIWCPLDTRGMPPFSRYVFGCDAATGQAGKFSSNSAIVGIDLRSGLQVYEFADNNIPPDELAEVLIVVGKWFYNAMIGWEHAGPGVSVTNKIAEIGYSNIYYRETFIKNSKKKTKKPGWFPSKEERTNLFNDIDSSVRKQRYMMQSQKILDECSQYIWADRTIKHSASRAVDNEAEKEANHGDRVIAWGVAIQCANTNPIEKIPTFEEGDESALSPFGTRHRRFVEQSIKKSQQNDWNDDVLTAYN